jgi:hypothetical protein
LPQFRELPQRASVLEAANREPMCLVLDAPERLRVAREQNPAPRVRSADLRSRPKVCARAQTVERTAASIARRQSRKAAGIGAVR